MVTYQTTGFQGNLKRVSELNVSVGISITRYALKRTGDESHYYEPVYYPQFRQPTTKPNQSPP